MSNWKTVNSCGELSCDVQYYKQVNSLEEAKSLANEFMESKNKGQIKFDNYEPALRTLKRGLPPYERVYGHAWVFTSEGRSHGITMIIPFCLY